MGFYHTIPVVEGYTRKQVIAFMKLKLSFDNRWLIKGFLRLWESQTETEKTNYISHGHNQYGFNKLDSLKMSTIYREYQSNKALNDNSLKYLKRKMEKYSAQICVFCDPKLMKKTMDTYFAEDKIFNTKNYKFKTMTKEEKKPLISMSICSHTDKDFKYFRTTSDGTETLFRCCKCGQIKRLRNKN
jgi:hypothetical protein